MPTCKKHGYYSESDAVSGMCPKCSRDLIGEYSNEKSGKTPLGYCSEHGYYYAKYKGTYDGCPVCAKANYG